MSKGIFALVMSGVIVAGGIYYFSSAALPQPVQKPITSGGAVEPGSVAHDMGNMMKESGVGTHMMPDGSMMMGAGMMGAVKTFSVSGQNFSFTPSEIRVKKGDKVRINFTNAGGWPHDWVVDGFNAQAPQVEAGKSSSVEFTADKAGTFEYYCSVGQHRQQGMVGKLVVE
ncbi:cupredoxin domain-containing protein [Candidatus Azambacteria bacterium]|nr:cupredoxin domain-containing protein [Candidatus Azambacteria bacterium]MBI3684833.1 cupredoxin domain-containing protein [Candidatus Azambacteria bacterium]